MIRKECAFRFILLLLVSIRVSLCAQNPDCHYTCYRASGNVQVDGDLSDRSWLDIPWSARFEDIEGDTRPAPPLETRMKMMWDDSCLYIGARLLEPSLFATLTTHDAIIFHDPDFEVFIDPDRDTENYYELEINAFGTIMDLFMARAYNKGGRYNLPWNFEGVRSAISLEGTINNPTDLDTAWTVEIAIPFRAFRGGDHIDRPPVPGDSWRINFSRVQWDLEQDGHTYKKKHDPASGRSLPEHNWVWAPTGVINMHVPDRWGYLDYSDHTPPPRFWVWMGQGDRTAEEWNDLLKGLDTLGIRGLLLNADTATLALVSSLASLHGMEIHAWIWTMNRGDADPAWLDYNRLGQSLAVEKAYVDYYKFMNPALPEVQDFIGKKFTDLMNVKGLRGIHMDYIRYVDALLPSGLQPKYGLVQDNVSPQFDYGYHPYMMQRFKQQYGFDPLDSVNPATDSLWLAFRIAQLNLTVERLKAQVNNQGLQISAAVFPTPEMSRTMVRQDWASWQLDAYFPMVYHNFYEMPVSWIGEVIATDKHRLPETSIICGLYLPALQDGDDLTQAMTAAMAGGADGIAFFSYGTMTDAIRKQIRRFTHKKNHYFSSPLTIDL